MAKPAEMSYSGAARNGKLADPARKAEEESSRSKHEEEDCVRKERELEG